MEELSSISHINSRSSKIVEAANRRSFSEIFDVLLWSVKFNAMQSIASPEAAEHIFRLSLDDDILNTKVAMPQLLRPQDVANKVQMLFSSLPPSSVLLSREDFVEMMTNQKSNSCNFTASNSFATNRLKDENKDTCTFNSSYAVEAVKKQTDIQTKSLTASSKSYSSDVAAISSYPSNVMLNSKDISSDSLHSNYLQTQQKRIRSRSLDRSVDRGNKNGFDGDTNMLTRSRSVGRSTTSSEIRRAHNLRLRDADTQDQIENKMKASYRFIASRKSTDLSYQGEHGERRRQGLSVWSGLHSCKH
jgi:hypothetical protein